MSSHTRKEQNMKKNNPYHVLEVKKTASADEIKRAFRKLAKKYHPDIHPGDEKAEMKFREINEAYEILSDEKKRAKLDRELEQGASGQATGFQQKEAAEKQKTTTKTGYRKAAGFTQEDFMKFNQMFDDFIGEPAKPKTKQTNQKMDFSQQFANYFGFRPK